MKTSITLFLIILSLQTLAQDIIIKQDGSEIKALVEEITPDVIKYRNFNQPEGPIRNTALIDVFMIIYKDGSREIIKKPEKGLDNRLLKIDSTVQKETKVKYENLNKEVIPQPEEIYIEDNNPAKAPMYSDNDKNLNSNSVSNNQKEDNYFSNRKNEYFSTAFGYGTSYGGFGLRADFRVGKKIGFGAHYGVGYFPFNGGGFLTGGGVKLYCYKGLYLNVQYGLVGIEKITLNVNNGNNVNHKEERYVLHGPSFLVGGDWFFGKHVGLNAGLGFTKVINSVLIEFAMTMDIGIIIKY